MVAAAPELLLFLLDGLLDLRQPLPFIEEPALAPPLSKLLDLAGEPCHRRLRDQRRDLAPALPVAFVLAPVRGVAVGRKPAAQALGEGVPVLAQPSPQAGGAGAFEEVARPLPLLRVVDFEGATERQGGT